MENIFKVLADDNRLSIVLLLINRELCINHISLGTNLKQANTSRNLKILREHNLVNFRKNKNNHYYSLNEDFFSDMPELYRYLKKLTKESKYQEDIIRMKAVKVCGCRGICECQL